MFILHYVFFYFILNINFIIIFNFLNFQIIKFVTIYKISFKSFNLFFILILFAMRFTFISINLFYIAFIFLWPLACYHHYHHHFSFIAALMHAIWISLWYCVNLWLTILLHFVYVIDFCISIVNLIVLSIIFLYFFVCCLF